MKVLTAPALHPLMTTSVASPKPLLWWWVDRRVMSAHAWDAVSTLARFDLSHSHALEALDEGRVQVPAPKVQLRALVRHRLLHVPREEAAFTVLWRELSR